MLSLPHFRRLALSPGVLDVNASLSTARQSLLLWAQNALKNGADALMIREGALPIPRLEELLPDLLPALHELGVPVLLNAPLAPTGLPLQGVHHKGHWNIPLPSNPTIWYGRSCHSVQEVLQAAADGYHYALLSPIFATYSHPEQTGIGLQTLAEACAKVPIPIYALGGVTLADEADILKAGAAGIAGIRCFM